MMPPAGLLLDTTSPSSPTSAFANPFSHYYTSAPSSPSRAAAIYTHFLSTSSPVVPFDWEERPGLPKSDHRHNYNADTGRNDRETGGIAADDDDDDSVDFAFEFGGQAAAGGARDDSGTATADELFEFGRIRPLNAVDHYPLSPTRFFSSPRRRGKEIDADRFASETEEATRGRERTVSLASGSRRGGRRTTRSLPPLRGSGAPDSVDISDTTATTITTNVEANSNSAHRPISAKTTTVATITCYVKGGIKRWGLRNLLLFRSASEGRASGGKKDPLRKYTGLSTMASSMLSGRAPALLVQDVKNATLRSADDHGVSRRRVARDGGSVGGSSRHVSPHEMLYAKNRAMSEELKKRTFLPYKQGLLGCLGFNPALHSLALGLGLGSAAGHRRI